jgi:hypothetical protein
MISGTVVYADIDVTSNQRGLSLFAGADAKKRGAKAPLCGMTGDVAID